MKTQLLFLFILVNYTNAWAQDSTLVTIKAGSSISEVLTPADIFLYLQYTSGHVFFRNGTKATALMNYNSLFDQVLFINAKGDTLALTDEKTIRFIAVANDTFYYDEGYIRLVGSNSVVKLAEKQIWEVADIRKIGSHNRPSTAFAITSYNTLTDGFGRTHELLLNEDLLLRKKAAYYFGDMYNRFVTADRKSLLLLFPKKQNILASYLKENKISFTKKEDLKKLAQFLAQNN